MSGNPLFFRPMVRTGPELLQEKKDKAIEAILTQAGISYDQVQTIVRQAATGATIAPAERELLRRAVTAVQQRLEATDPKKGSTRQTNPKAPKSSPPRLSNLRRYLDLLEQSL